MRVIDLLADHVVKEIEELEVAHKLHSVNVELVKGLRDIGLVEHDVVPLKGIVANNVDANFGEALNVLVAGKVVVEVGVHGHEGLDARVDLAEDLDGGPLVPKVLGNNKSELGVQLLLRQLDVGVNALDHLPLNVGPHVVHHRNGLNGQRRLLKGHLLPHALLDLLVDLLLPLQELPSVDDVLPRRVKELEHELALLLLLVKLLPQLLVARHAGIKGDLEVGHLLLQLDLQRVLELELQLGDLLLELRHLLIGGRLHSPGRVLERLLTKKSNRHFCGMRECGKVRWVVRTKNEPMQKMDN